MIRERAVRAFAGAVVGLRYLVVLAWIAAALAVTWWMPGLGSGEPLPLGGLIPENAESAQVAALQDELPDSDGTSALLPGTQVERLVALS